MKVQNFLFIRKNFFQKVNIKKSSTVSLCSQPHRNNWDRKEKVLRFCKL